VELHAARGRIGRAILPPRSLSVAHQRGRQGRSGRPRAYRCRDPCDTNAHQPMGLPGDALSNGVTVDLFSPTHRCGPWQRNCTRHTAGDRRAMSDRV